MELRWYQHAACEAAWDFLCSQAGNPVICLPTGAGKSLIIGQIAHDAVTRYGGRVLVLAHRKELLVQNSEKIRIASSDLDVGLYSAGLDARDTEHGVVVAGIQSIFRRAGVFGSRQLVLIDEVHLVPHDGEGMYRRFLTDLREINPHLRLVGMTATPYRLDCGPLCRPDGLFQKVCYNAPIRQLIEEGWLCSLTTAAAETVVDLVGVHLRAGEFVASEVEAAFGGVIQPTCAEILRKTAGRKAIVVFCSGVRHAELVSDCLSRLTGERVGLVTGDTLPLERDATLRDFRTGDLRWLCNVDVLTTGFDAPHIDAIAVLRATMSPGLFAQIVGRGFRIAPGKADCLILDFGGNIRRHGPIDAPAYGTHDKLQRMPGEAPTRQCPNCGIDCLLQARECSDCGFLFPRSEDPRHETTADELQILSEPEVMLVEEIEYSIHWKKRAAPDAVPTMRVDYYCQREGMTGNLSREQVSEWVCLEHVGFARRKAEQWWTGRSICAIPTSAEEAVDLCQRGAVASPRSITVCQQGRWWRVLSAVLDEIPETWVDEVTSDPFAIHEDCAF